MTTEPSDTITTTVEDDGVTVTRELTGGADWVAASIQIESDRDEEVLVRVVDEFPSSLSVEESAFAPDARPDMGDVSSDSATLRQTVGEDSVLVQYGVLLSEPLSELRWEPPTIRSVESAARARALTTQGDRGSDASNDWSADSTETAVSSTLASQLMEAFDTDADESARRTPDAATESDERVAPETSANATESDSGHDVDERSGATEQSTDDERTATDRESEEGTATTRRSVGVEAAPPDRPVDEETAAGASARAVPQSVSVRLDRLSARVEEFSAYATALEGLIDEYGTGTEVIDGLESEIEDLDARLADLSSDVTSVRQSHDSDVETIESDIQSVEGRLDEFDTDLQEVRSSVDDVKAEIRAVSDDVAEMRDEMASVEAEIESLNEFRQSLAEISHVGSD